MLKIVNDWVKNFVKNELKVQKIDQYHEKNVEKWRKIGLHYEKNY